MVQVGEGLVVQLDGRRRGGAQHVLEWGVFGLTVRGEAGVLLLEDGQSQHIAGGDREEKNKMSFLKRTRQSENSSFGKICGRFP